MARHSRDNPYQIMPEHCGFASEGLSKSVSRACDDFFRRRGTFLAGGMRRLVNAAAAKGKSRKARKPR